MSRRKMSECPAPPTINATEMMELGLFSEMFAKKRPMLSVTQKNWLLNEILQRKVLGEEFFVNIIDDDDSTPEKDKLRLLLPERVFVKRGLIACSCTHGGDKLWGVWPNGKKGAVCAKQELFLSTLHVTLIETLFKKSHTVDVMADCSVIINHHDDACQICKESLPVNQHSTQSD